jgi:hypothetical protein
MLRSGWPPMLEAPVPARRTTMERDDLEDMGPIDYLVVEFPVAAQKRRILGS